MKTDVVGDPDAVAQAITAAEGERLVDRGQPERLPRVDRVAHAPGAQIVEGVEMPGRRIARLRARDVEADGAAVLGSALALGLWWHPGHLVRPAVRVPALGWLALVAVVLYNALLRKVRVLMLEWEIANGRKTL